jgi:hypothetical protein
VARASLFAFARRMDRLSAIVGPAQSLELTNFDDGNVVAPAPPGVDDWHIDPVVKQAAAEQRAARDAADAVVAAKVAKAKAKAGDGKASILGATFNLSNAVRRPKQRCRRHRGMLAVWMLPHAGGAAAVWGRAAWMRPTSRTKCRARGRSLRL